MKDEKINLNYGDRLMVDGNGLKKNKQSVHTDRDSKFRQEIIECQKRIDSLVASKANDQQYLINAYMRCVKIRQALLEDTKKVDPS